MKLCFFFNVYRDEPLALRLMSQLDRHYPGYRALAITDGPSTLTPSADTVVYEGDRLKRQGSLGQFIARNFRLCLQQDADLFIGLDPDTFVWKPFEQIPDADWFGQCNKSFVDPFQGLPVVVGACAGYSRQVLEALMNSKLLEEDAIVNQAPIYRPDLAGCEVPAEDYVIGWALSNLGFAPMPWPENRIMGGNVTQKQSGPPYIYAATHPCKAAIHYDMIAPSRASPTYPN